MITSTRQWNATALPRYFKRAMNAIKTTSVSAQKDRETQEEKGFFESYEKMMEAQAILILGLNNKRW
jgi:hypothetical protein